MIGTTRYPFVSDREIDDFQNGVQAWVDAHISQDDAKKYNRHQPLYIPGKLMGFNAYNNLSRAAGPGANRVKQSMQQEIGYHILAAKLEPCTNKVDIDFIWYEASRRRDPDNIASAKKFVLDALVQYGILQNDKHDHVGNFTDTFHICSTYGVALMLKERADCPVDER